MTRSAQTTFVEELVKRFPALVPLLETHRKKYDGAIRPPAFFDSLAMWILEQVKLGREGNRDFSQILGHLDASLGDERAEIRELILGSFMEVTTSEGIRVFPIVRDAADLVLYVENLVKDFPVLQPILDEHLADWEGEILSHLFFGDVTRWAVAQFLTDEKGRAEVSRLLERFEQDVIRGSQPVQELIVVSFLENLPGSGEPGSEIIRMLGPQLTEKLKLLEQFWEDVMRAKASGQLRKS